MTLGQETRWAYSTKLPSPHGAPSRLDMGLGAGLITLSRKNQQIQETTRGPMHPSGCRMN